jgi:hypothetical protein
MSRNWVAVASAEHVRIGRGQGFMQVCHGKAAPLRRLHSGDGVVYYSPTAVFRGNDRLQAFHGDRRREGRCAVPGGYGRQLLPVPP